MIALSPTAPVRSRRRSSPSPVSSGPRAFGYVRVSTYEQGRSGLGIEAQEASICEACAVEGWQLTDTFRDVETGAKDERKGLQTALRALRLSYL